jgi:hypothetical protein
VPRLRVPQLHRRDRVTAAAGTMCGLCGQQCTPLADFDEPTCIRCEEIRAALIAAGEHPIVPAVRVPLFPDAVTDRPYLSYFGPAPAAVIDQLVGALFPGDATRVRRTRSVRRSA